MKQLRMMGGGVISVGLAVLLTACQQQPETSRWFPLQDGRSWHYQQTRIWGDDKRVSRFSVETRELNEQEASFFARHSIDTDHLYVRRTSNGTDYYVAASPEGIERVAKKVLIEHLPRLDKTPRLILPDEVDLDTGAAWEVETQPYILASTAPHIPWIADANRFAMMYEVVDMDATVETAAGTFKHCIQVQGQAKISFYADPRLGYQDMYLTQTEWYARDIGLVKLVRDEPLDLEMYQGGTLTLELIQYQ